MFNEFLECTQEEDGIEIVTIICNDCVMQVTLEELRLYIAICEKNAQQKDN